MLPCTISSTTIRYIQGYKPGFPRTRVTGKPGRFSKRKRGFGLCSNPGFRDWHLLPIFHANDTFSRPKWIKTAIQCYAALILFTLRLTFWLRASLVTSSNHTVARETGFVFVSRYFH